MTIEIELKFIATPQAIAQLPAFLAAWPHQHAPAIALSNIYFETDDHQLRRWDMGLRIRGVEQKYEMTLKGKGDSIGGLHQRAEYNVDIASPELDIARLPAEIWPQGTDIDALQARLQPLFSTHFQRERWVVTYGNSEIEVALDQGDVKAGELSEALHEIELELKQGERDDLLQFATEFAQLAGLRLGSLSKAARGYALAQGNAPLPVKPVPLLQLAPKATVEQAMVAIFQLGLKQWQYHEEVWLRGNADAQHAVLEALEIVRQGFSLFSALISRKASSELRQSLTELEEALAGEQVDAQEICFTPLWVQTQLALTRWLVTQRWQAFTDQKAQTKLNGSFKRFADIMLGRIAANMKETISHVRQPNEYHDKAPRLARHLIAVTLLAGAYPSTVAAWQDNWRQLLLAIDEHQYNTLAWLSNQALKQPAFWLNGSAR